MFSSGAGTGGRVVSDVGLQPLACWGYGSECQWGYGFECRWGYVFESQWGYGFECQWGYGLECQWGLRFRLSMGLRVRILSVACLSVCYECCVLSGRGLCDGLITRPEESYRLWSCSLDNVEDLTY